MQQRNFPSGFLWGVATSAHQVEGHNVNSDVWVEEHLPGSPFVEPSGSAIDHWRRYESDIDMLAELGIPSYRFSVEWAKVEPEPGEWSLEALQHYRDVCDACNLRGVQPVITLHHFTSPQWLMRHGGWRGEATPQLFARYVERVMRHLGDAVRFVVTMNECNISAVLHDYVKQLVAKGDRTAIERLSNTQWKKMAAEQCGTTADRYCTFMGAADETGIATVMAAHRAARTAIRRVAEHVQVGFSLSLQQSQARPGAEELAVESWQRKFRQWLPLMAEDDFVAAQIYTRTVWEPAGAHHIPAGARMTQMNFEYAPEAVSAVLRTIASETSKPILITENGVAVDDDQERVEFIGRALAGVHQCIAEGVKVMGYFHWSAFDNFEWYFGYAKRFGLIAVDRQTLVRTPKDSARYFGNIARTNALPAEARAHALPEGGRDLLDILRSGRTSF